jgi:DNA-binding XRE family transcriptional regulator
MKRGTKGAWSAEYDWIEESVGANVAAIRRRCGVTQEQLAKWVGIEVTTLQRIEHGHGNCTARVLYALTKALHHRLEDLFIPAKVQPAKRGRPKKGPPAGEGT